jgi:ferredoxin-NADP reductase/uncharacterized protein YcbX
VKFMATLSNILIFPVKSLDGIEVNSSRILPSGALEHDRTWAIFDSDGNYVNGKRHATIHRLRSHVDLESRKLTLRESDRGLQAGTFDLDRERGTLETWLSDYFGFRVSFKEDHARGFPDDTDSPGPTVISVATLEEIGKWFALPVAEVRRRFRTNIEIDGVPAFWEDRLFGATGTSVRFRLGSIRFEGINPCQRCVVPPRDPETGANNDRFVRRFTELRNRTLPDWSTRERFNHFYRVAVNTRLDGNLGGEIRLGDRIELLRPPLARPDNKAEISREPTHHWAGELVIEQVRDETANVKTFRLRSPGGGNIPFRFRAGEFLTVTIPNDQETLQRCYTIASSPLNLDFIELTIKQEGLVSGLMHRQMSAGASLTASSPMGAFGFDGSGVDAIVLIAGGVGITPLMSKVRFLSSTNWRGRIDLIYSVKTSHDIIFREELEELEKEWGRVRLHVTVTSRDPEWTGRTGRMTLDWIRSIVPDIAHRHVRVCGPTAMASSVKRILRQLDVAPSQVAIESFGGRSNTAKDEGSDHPIRFARSDRTSVVKGGTSLLDAAIAARVRIDYGCRAGVCGRCKAVLIEGEVESENDFALSAKEKAASMILTCQARALGPVAIDC